MSALYLSVLYLVVIVVFFCFLKIPYDIYKFRSIKGSTKNRVVTWVIILFALIVTTLTTNSTIISSQNTVNQDLKLDATRQEEELQKQIDTKVTQQLKEYLYEGFGGNGRPKLQTSWYNLMSDLEVTYSTEYSKYIVTIYTMGYTDNMMSKAEEFAGAVLTWANSFQTTIQVHEVVFVIVNEHGYGSTVYRKVNSVVNE